MYVPKTFYLKNAELANSFFSKLRGLMFRKNFPNALVFSFSHEDYWVFHSFFVFNPFDMVFLDKNKRVLDVREAVSPFVARIVPNEKCMHVVEFPLGEVKRRGICKGVKLSW